MVMLCLDRLFSANSLSVIVCVLFQTCILLLNSAKVIFCRSWMCDLCLLMMTNLNTMQLFSKTFYVHILHVPISAKWAAKYTMYQAIIYDGIQLFSNYILCGDNFSLNTNPKSMWLISRIPMRNSTSFMAQIILLYIMLVHTKAKS